MALFHVMKTTYIYDKPEHRNSWIVDFTIYSVDKDASDDDTSLSTCKMRVKTHIYPDPSNQSDDIPGAHRTPKPTIWTTPSVFTNARLSDHLIYPTPMKSQSS